MKRFLFFIASLNAYAFCINAGGPTTFYDPLSVRCFGDSFFLASPVSWAYVDPLVGPTQTEIEWRDLRYGPAFSYQFPAVPNFYTIILDFMDPNSTREGQRVFTVTVNGAATQEIDLYKEVGARGHYKLQLFAVSNGVIRIDFKARVGNALVNRIEFYQVRPFDLFDASQRNELKLALKHDLDTQGPVPFLRAPFFNGDLTTRRRFWEEHKRYNKCYSIGFASNDDYVVIITSENC